MGLTARQAAGLFAGTLGFGVLTFASGLMIGIGIAPGLLEMPQPAAAPASPAKPAPAASPAVGPAIAAARPGTGSATAQTAGGAPPAAAAPAGTPPQTADAAPAAVMPTPPIPVKDFRVGLPLEEVAATNPLGVPDAMMAGNMPMAGGAVASPAMPSGAKMPVNGAAAASAAASAVMPSPFLLSVQVGSFLMKQNADRLAAELNSKAYAAQVVVAQNPGGKAWYHVVLAPVRDVNAVTQLAQEFSATEGRSAQVVSWLDGK